MKRFFTLLMIVILLLVALCLTALAQGNETNARDEQLKSEEVVHMDNALLAVVITAVCGIIGPSIASIYKERNQLKLKKTRNSSIRKNASI